MSAARRFPNDPHDQEREDVVLDALQYLVRRTDAQTAQLDRISDRIEYMGERIGHMSDQMDRLVTEAHAIRVDFTALNTAVHVGVRVAVAMTGMLAAIFIAILTR